MLCFMTWLPECSLIKYLIQHTNSVTLDHRDFLWWKVRLWVSPQGCLSPKRPACIITQLLNNLSVLWLNYWSSSRNSLKLDRPRFLVILSEVIGSQVEMSPLPWWLPGIVTWSLEHAPTKLLMWYFNLFLCVTSKISWVFLYLPL